MRLDFTKIKFKLRLDYVKVEFYAVELEFLAGKHGCSARGATPAFDVWGTLLLTCRVASCHMVFFYFYLTCAYAAQTRADLGKTGEMADLGRNSKKKRTKVQNALFELNTQTLL